MRARRFLVQNLSNPRNISRNYFLAEHSKSTQAHLAFLNTAPVNGPIAL